MNYFNHTVQQLVVAAVYFLLALLGLFLSPSHSIGATFYPAAGFALGVMLAFGPKSVVGVFIGALTTIAWLTVDTSRLTSDYIAQVPLISAFITAQAFIGYKLLWRIRDIKSSLINKPIPLLFTFCYATFVSTFVGSALSITYLSLNDAIQWNNAVSLWLRWWTGDMLGIVLVTPLTVSLFAPFADKRRTFRRVSLPVLLVISFIAGLTYKVHIDQSQQAENAIRQKLEKFQYAISVEVARAEEKVSALGRFYENSMLVTQDEFESFVDVNSNVWDFVNGYSWNPVVLPEEVEQFETNLAIGYETESLKIRELENNWVNDLRPDWHVVIERIYPESLASKAIGLDVMSDITRGKALLKSIEANQVRVTAPLRLVQSKSENEVSVLIVKPVYNKNGVKKYREAILPNGFAVGVLNITNMLEQRIVNNQAAAFRILLKDISNMEDQVIYEKAFGRDLYLDDFEQTIEFDILGRTWAVSLVPAEELVNKLSSNYCLWFNLFSLILGTAFVFFIFRNNFDQESIEREVRSRTTLMTQVRHIQSAYINQKDFDQMLVQLVGEIETFTGADAAVVSAKCPENRCFVELICTNSSYKDSPHLRLLAHFVESGNYANVSWSDVSTYEMLDAAGRVALVIPWTEENKHRSIILSVKSKEIDDNLISQLSLVRESLESTANAILEREHVTEVMRELKENSALLSQAEAIGNSGTWRLNHQTAHHTFSNNVYRIFNAQKEGLRSPYEIFQEAIHPDDRDLIKGRVSESLKKKTGIFEVQHRILMNGVDGEEVRFVRERFEHSYDGEGKLQATKGIIVDVTDFLNETKRKELESIRVQEQKEAITNLTFNLSLKESLNEKFEEIISEASRVLQVRRATIWLLSEDRSALKCSSFVENMVHIQSLPANLVAEEIPAYFRSFRTEPIMAVEDTSTDQRVCELFSGYLKPLGIASMLDVSITRDGEFMGVLCLEHVGEKRKWLPDETSFANTLAVMVGQTIDAYERSEFLSTVVKQQEDMNKILDSMVDSVITINQRGVILSANEATTKQFSFSRDELIGANVSVLMPSDIASQHDGYLENYVHGGEAKVMGVGRIVTGQKSSGEVFPMRLSVAELSSSENDERIFVGALHDLTLEQKQQEQIQRSGKMDALGQLTGGIAHDFNNILGVMLGYSEMLLEFIPEDQSRLIEYAKQIEMAGEKAKALIEKLRAFSKKDKGVQKIVNLNRVLNDQKLMLQKAVTSKNTLLLDLSSILYNTRLDESDLENGLLNLCVNAMHAMPEGGEIKVTTRNETLPSSYAETLGLPPGAYVSIAVSDTGVGMPKKMLEHIFEPFFSTKGEKGTGLGLSQLYGFVTRSLGAITVDSTIGLGTVFKMYFPVEDTLQFPSTPEIAERLNYESKGNEAVLIVDDEEQLRTLLAEKISSQGYIVFQAANGNEALEILKAEDISLVLSDIIMPKMDGVALANKVIDQFPDTKLQLMSGFSDELHSNLNDINLFKERLVKPFKFDEALGRIRKLLDSVV